MYGPPIACTFVRPPQCSPTLEAESQGCISRGIHKFPKVLRAHRSLLLYALRASAHRSLLLYALRASAHRSLLLYALRASAHRSLLLYALWANAHRSLLL
jgi:hypothetical protein